MNGRTSVTPGSGLLDLNASQTRRAELSEPNSYWSGVLSRQFRKRRTGISIYHVVGAPLWHSVKWVSASARNSPNEAKEISMRQRSLVLAVFEEGSECVDDCADFRKDVRVSFRKKSISFAPFHLGTRTGQDMVSLHDDTDFGDPRRGVSLWRFIRFSRGASMYRVERVPCNVRCCSSVPDAGHLDTACQRSLAYGRT